jgi:hypothetical protein
MERLPLGQAGLMKHELIELGPLAPLHVLLGDGEPTGAVHAACNARGNA